jgi:hypothetical protein
VAKTPKTTGLSLLILLLSVFGIVDAGCFNIDRRYGVKWQIVANNFMKRLLCDTFLKAPESREGKFPVRSVNPSVLSVAEVYRSKVAIGMLRQLEKRQ